MCCCSITKVIGFSFINSIINLNTDKPPALHRLQNADATAAVRRTLPVGQDLWTDAAVACGSWDFNSGWVCTPSFM